MAMTHEFGIMAEDPLPRERYDSYEPLEYNAISVHDQTILCPKKTPLLKLLLLHDGFLHSNQDY